MRTRPFPVDYALAREYLELRRAQTGEPKRGHAFQQARGGMAAVASVASSTHLVTPGTAAFVSLASSVIRARPIEPGPEWLHAAAEDLVAAMTEARS